MRLDSSRSANPSALAGWLPEAVYTVCRPDRGHPNPRFLISNFSCFGIPVPKKGFLGTTQLNATNQLAMKAV